MSSSCSACSCLKPRESGKKVTIKRQLLPCGLSNGGTELLPPQVPIPL